MTLHRYRAARVFLCLIFVGGWLAACSEKPEEKIIGRWHAADTAEGNVLEFFQGGTVSFLEGITGIAINGDYEFLNDDTIKIELGGILAIAGASIYKVSFSDDQLLLKTQNSDDVLTYERVE